MKATPDEARAAEDRLYLGDQMLAAHFALFPTAATGNIFNALLIIVPFFRTASLLPLLLVAGSVIACALHLAYLWHARRHFERAEVCALTLRAEISAAVLGVIWGLALCWLGWIATPRQMTVVVMLAVGMMAAATLTCATMPRAGRLFVVPIAIGMIAALAQRGNTEAWVTIGLVASFSFAIHRSFTLNYANQQQRMIGQHRLSESAATVQMLLNDFESQASDWLWRTDRDGNIIAPSRRFAEAAGEANLAGKPLDGLFDDHPETIALRAALTEHRSFRDLVVKRHTGAGECWWQLSGQPQYDANGLVTGMRGVATDITAARTAESRITYMAQHDALTGLPNRFLLDATIGAALAERGEDEEIALLYLDLDQFKAINDTLGHGVGDGVLKTVAALLRAEVSGGDMVARLGGDEFVICLAPSSDRARAHAVAASVIAALSAPMEIDGHQVVSGTSVGMAFAPGDGASAQALVGHADLALYAAKRDGRGRCMLFAPEMRDAMHERRSLELELRAALRNGEMVLHYQPLIDVEHGHVTGYEALLRWEHPERGLVMPGEFIALAEENGFIVQLGEWVIRRALADASTWPDDLRVAINIAPAQMRGTTLVTTLVQALGASGIAPDRVELEITETLLMQRAEATIAILHKLKALGVRIALDDFGTGYSSLNYLRSFPFDKIKIDRCFITDIHTREDCRAIVRAVTGLATSLGMETVAEGVETAEQLARLRAEGCNTVQGHYFERAAAADDIAALRPSPDAAAAPSAPMTPLLPAADVVTRSVRRR